MRLPLLLSIFAAVVLTGCATPLEKQARAQQKMERQAAAENSRATEQRRMSAVSNGEMSSKRGADIFVPDTTRSFDPNRATAGSARTFASSAAPTKSFYSDRQPRIDAYQAHDFYGAKSNDAAKRAFATGEANTKSRSIIPNLDKNPANKTAATRLDADANKAASSRELPDAQRQYLGQEHKKVGQTLDPKELANWRNGGEGVFYSDGTVERVSNMKQLSLDDIRDLLNKSK